MEKEENKRGEEKNLVKNARKENARNNVNSISCDYCGIVNISRNNNKFGV